MECLSVFPNTFARELRQRTEQYDKKKVVNIWNEVERARKKVVATPVHLVIST